MSSTMTCLEEEDSSYALDPKQYDSIKDRSVFAYDESTQDYKALEGDLVFCSSALVKIEEKYQFNLTVLPYFITAMRKFEKGTDDEIRFTEEPSAERNKILVDAKKTAILEGTEPHSIVLIDGPLIGGMASHYMNETDEQLRDNDSIAVYFVKNSDSRLVVSNSRNSELQKQFNSDLHWATHHLSERSRSAFFRYTDAENSENTKVFCYLRTLGGFPERVEMHTSTYEKYSSLVPSILNLASYYHIIQGDYYNPQVRPIAVAEKYAREGIRMLNIPVLLARIGFHPTVNQARFG